MKLYLKPFALGAVLFMGAAFATADTLTFVSYGTGSTPSGGTPNNTALAFVGSPTTTFDIGTGGVWTGPVNNYGILSSWVSKNAGDCPGCGNIEPNGTYVYTTNLNDIAGETYTGTLNVLADDTVDVFINGIKIVTDSMNSSNDLKCESSVPNCLTVDTISFSYLATGSDVMTFSVDQTGLVATGVDFDAQVTGVPEPSSLMLLGTGLLGSAGMLLRRRRA